MRRVKREERAWQEAAVIGVCGKGVWGTEAVALGVERRGNESRTCHLSVRQGRGTDAATSPSHLHRRPEGREEMRPGMLVECTGTEPS